MQTLTFVIDSAVIDMSDHWANGHYAHCIANCAFLLYLDVFIRLPETVQIDLGTDAKHCFCKAGDLLAVVEWYLWISANFEKTYNEGVNFAILSVSSYVGSSDCLYWSKL